VDKNYKLSLLRSYNRYFFAILECIRTFSLFSTILYFLFVAKIYVSLCKFMRVDVDCFYDCLNVSKLTVLESQFTYF